MDIYSNYLTKAVKKIYNDFINTDKNNARSVKRKEIYDYKVLIQDYQISRIKINLLLFVGSLFDQINILSFLCQLLYKGLLIWKLLNI